MIELYELQQFVAFADAGTLSEAAKQLHLSQPALSRNMKKLEDEVGIVLFDRQKNKLSLNRNGEYVLSMARKLLADSRFLTQSDRFSFDELAQASSLPFFATNLSEKNKITSANRIYIPVSDEDATVTYYLVCKREQKKAFKALFNLL